MTQQTWNELSFFEQLSNIDGDVERLIRAHEDYLAGEAKEDYGLFYLDKIEKLIKMTMHDDKNAGKGYRAIELFDEFEEIKGYLSGKYDAEYLRRYWNEYTLAIS